MAIILVTRTLPTSTKLSGEETDLALVAGKMLTVETTPGGAELLSAECPVGKAWKVSISVNIDEVDV